MTGDTLLFKQFTIVNYLLSPRLFNTILSFSLSLSWMPDNHFFTIELSSNASLDVYPDNTLASFRTSLAEPIELEEGKWWVSLSEITYPRNVINVDQGRFDFYWYYKNKWLRNLKIPEGNYTSLTDIVSQMETAIHRSRGVWNKQGKKDYLGDGSANSKGVWTLSSNNLSNVSNDLFFILGLKNSELFHGEVSQKPHFPVDTCRYHQVYLYTDFIEPQFVGNSRAPLLRSFQLFDSRQIAMINALEEKSDNKNSVPIGTLHQVFDRSQKRLVTKRVLNDILIEIRSDFGDLVSFTGVGRTYVTLLFEKVV